MPKIIPVILIFLFAASAGYADVSGNLSLPSRNLSIVTGVFAHTVDFCNSNSECRGYTCFLDYDTTSEAGTAFAGWCNSTDVTNCYHNGTAHQNGTKLCDSSTTYRTCQSPSWSATTGCPANQTCSSGTCAASSSSGSSGGGGSSSSDDTQSIAFVSSPADFSLKQGDSVTKNAKVNNTGKITLKNTTLTVSGILPVWFAMTPEKDNFTTVGEIVEFNITFNVPPNADVKDYSIILKATTSNASVTASKTFTMKVLPSQETVDTTILPKQEELLQQLAALENKLAGIEGTVSKEDYNSIQNTLNNAKRKLIDAQKSIDGQDFFAASEAQRDAAALLDDADRAIREAKPLETVPFSILPVVIGIVAIAAIAFVVYMLLPPKETGYLAEKGWIAPPQKKKSMLARLRRLFRRKKESMGYEFRK